MESIDYIDDYFEKRLSVDEASRFEQRIKDDALFAAEVAFYVSAKHAVKNELAAKTETINGINFIAQKVELPNADAIKNLAYQLKDIVSDLFLVLAAAIDGKPNLTVMLSENLVKEKGLNASNIVRELAKEIQGGGGGQSFFATAGGQDLSGLESALKKALGLVR